MPSETNPGPLDPENYQPDFLVAAEVFRQFASEVADFTLREVREELHSRGIATPESKANFRSMFEDMQATVSEHYSDHGHTVQWSAEREGRDTFYQLAHVETVDPTSRTLRVPLRSVVELRSVPPIASDEAAPEPAFMPSSPELLFPIEDPVPSAPLQPVMTTRLRESEQAPQPAAETPEVTPTLASAATAEQDTKVFEAVLARINDLLDKSEQGAMKPAWLLSHLDESAGIPPEVTKAVIVKAKADGRLFQVPVKGQRFITLQPPAEPTTPTFKQPTPETETPKVGKRPINDQEIELAIAVLDYLAVTVKHFNQGQTLKNLHAELGNEFSKRNFNRFLRTLQAERYIVIDGQGPNFGPSRKSPRVRLRSQDFKQRWNANRDGYISHIKQIELEGK